MKTKETLLQTSLQRQVDVAAKLDLAQKEVIDAQDVVKGVRLSLAELQQKLLEAEKEVAVLNKTQLPTNPIAHIPKLLALSGNMDMSSEERAAFDKVLLRMYEQQQQRDLEAAKVASEAAPGLPPLPAFLERLGSSSSQQQPPLQSKSQIEMGVALGLPSVPATPPRSLPPKHHRQVALESLPADAFTTPPRGKGSMKAVSPMQVDSQAGSVSTPGSSGSAVSVDPYSVVQTSPSSHAIMSQSERAQEAAEEAKVLAIAMAKVAEKAVDPNDTDEDLMVASLVGSPTESSVSSDPATGEAAVMLGLKEQAPASVNMFATNMLLNCHIPPTVCAVAVTDKFHEYTGMVSVLNPVGRHPLHGVQEAVRDAGEEDRQALEAARLRVAASILPSAQTLAIPTDTKPIALFRGRTAGASRIKDMEEDSSRGKQRDRSRSGGDEDEFTTSRKIVVSTSVPHMAAVESDDV